MLNSGFLVYFGIINRTYIQNHYCKDYIYKQKNYYVKERKMKFFFRIAKTQKKNPYYFKLLGNLTQLIQTKKQSCLYGNTFHFI